MIIVFLLPQDYQKKGFDNWKFEKFVNDLRSEGLNIEVILEGFNFEDVRKEDDLICESISRHVVDKIDVLNSRST